MKLLSAGRTYKDCTVKRITDGDTFHIHVPVDVGFRATTSILPVFRVNNLDTPELFSPRNAAELEHARQAKVLAESLLLNKPITVISYKIEIYGRWGCDIILPDGHDFATVMKEQGMQKRASY